MKNTSQADGYVYLLKSGKHYKIGLSKDVGLRAIQISPKLPIEPELICMIKTDNMRELEAEFHARFAEKRTNGEWFLLGSKDVEWIKNYPYDCTFQQRKAIHIECNSGTEQKETITIQARITKKDDLDLWDWHEHCVNRSGVVRQALRKYLGSPSSLPGKRASLDKIGEQLYQINQIGIKILERMGK